MYSCVNFNSYKYLHLHFKVYTSSLSKLYDREVKEFLEAAKNKLQPRFERKGIVAFINDLYMCRFLSEYYQGIVGIA